ncbi:UNVERIFIED_CONTAM: Lateral signaling target protein 2 [Siphonaria sp. JEL0065]|nr:Lateral signaling target protein 2 [Siphonaria sp. JEL0065]
MPLTLYYHADQQVSKCVASLAKVGDTRSDLFRRRNEKLHISQRVLLDSIYIIYSEIDEDLKAPRDYIRQLPPDDQVKNTPANTSILLFSNANFLQQRELTGGFSENIFFASQALNKGYRIRGIEQYTSELIDNARQLAASMDALRYVFHTRLLRNPAPPHMDLQHVLKDFDASWTAFEKKICFFYFAATYNGIPGRIDETHLFQVLMSEAILRALNCNYISLEQVQSFDPSLILAIPRLSLFAALHHTPDMVNVTDSRNSFRWFRSKSELLKTVKERIGALEEQQIHRLEKMLADTEGDLNTELQHDVQIQSIFVDICSVSDQLMRSREVVGMLSRVFSMYKEAESEGGK